MLHVIYDDPANPWVGGGGAVRVRELYKHLAGRVNVTVATGNFPGAHDETVEGIRYVRLGAQSPYAWSRLTFGRGVTRMLRTARYDAAIFDFSGYSPVFLPRNRPTGVTVHHTSEPTARHRWGRVLSFALGKVERTMMRRARRASATSLASRATIESIAPGMPIDMVAAGVPDDLFSLERTPAGFLLYFGRIDIYHKGLDTLLEAVAILVKERPELEIRIAGRGKDSERVAALIRSLGIEKNVRLIGAVSDAERNALLAGAEVQLMPSRFEGFGLAAAEAMAAGVPLVASEAGSLPEVVDAPRGGVLVPVGDPQALARATARLLDNPEERSALSSSARESARRFQWRAVANDHLKFIMNIAATQNT
ncbi:MAG TPA: glycosyltransferase family 4 protein [Gemmatimonadaceae bacterium]|nr:glycosyltransferase family 4 protein [Gemmatimonadaceae bacterium]